VYAMIACEQSGRMVESRMAKSSGGSRSSVPIRSMVDNRGVSSADLREQEVESRYEATFAVVLVIGLQVTLALASLGAGWKLIGLPGWVWLVPAVPEAALLVALAWSLPRHRSNNWAVAARPRSRSSA
jgi:hypothetical protein